MRDLYSLVYHPSLLTYPSSTFVVLTYPFPHSIQQSLGRHRVQVPLPYFGTSGMEGSIHSPSKSGLTFDHILSRLQGELQKSRETGAELHSLNGSMSEIHDTLSGTMVGHLSAPP